MKKQLCVTLFVLLLLLSGGCERSLEKDYFTYRKGNFAGEVRGSMNDVAFCASIDLQRVGTEWQVSVVYMEPAVLAGKLVSAACDASGVPMGAIEMRCEGGSFSCDGVVFAGLLRPATVWLLQAEIASVQKNGEEYLLSFATGEIMRLREDGLPIFVSGEDFSMEMVWMERSESV